MKKSQSRKASLSEKLRAKFIVARAQKIIPLQEFAQIKRDVAANIEGLRSAQEIARSGGDPVFALYASAAQLLSFCCQVLLGMPELQRFSERLVDLEDDYMPGYPPMSPITDSFYAMWTLCDLRITSGTETLAELFINLGDLFSLDASYLELLNKLVGSRMGVYEHCGFKGKMIMLRELVSNKEILFVGNSGYPGKKGELWYVRTAPPPIESIPYWTGMGTPYVLRFPEKNEWLKFFERNSIRSSEVGYERRLESFLKFGPSSRYWSEFIFEGYSAYNDGAVFLWGLPDVAESRPHSDSFDPDWHLSKISANS